MSDLRSDTKTSRGKTAVVVGVILVIALIHLFKVGSYLDGKLFTLFRCYFLDIAIAFGMYFLLCVDLVRIRFLQDWRMKALLVFLVASAIEALQAVGIPLLGRTYDPYDFLMFGVGALSAALLDRALFARIFSFWSPKMIEGSRDAPGPADPSSSRSTEPGQVPAEDPNPHETLSWPDVMISYKVDDKKVAFRIRDHLEEAGISCWIAPDCILVGENYQVAVGRAIRACGAVVLVYSDVTEQSREVCQEISMAFRVEKPIIPFQIAKVEPEELGYVLAGKHRLEAIPLKPAHYGQLVDLLGLVLTRGGPRPRRRRRRRFRIRDMLRIPMWAYLCAFLLIALPITYYKLIPQWTNESLSKAWASRNLDELYDDACAYQDAWYLRDKSIPTYWRVMACQTKNYNKWCKKANPERIEELTLEYQEAIRRNDEGAKQDDLKYQWAHFLRITGRTAEAMAVLKELQSDFPDSNWQEGTAYYFALLCREAGDDAGFKEQKARLESYPINGEVFDFEQGCLIKVKTAIKQLSAPAQSTTMPQTAPAENAS